MRSRFMAAFAVAALAVLISLPSSATAQKGNKAGGQKGNGPKGQNGQPNTAMIASRMISEYDRNGDQSLNAQELAAALTAMRERRGEGKEPGAGKGKGQGGKGKGPKSQN